MRKCNCSGQCGPQDTDPNRREFITIVGAATAALFVPAVSARADFDLPPDEFKQWQRSLFETAPPRRYFSDRHTDARLHLGGIGTGNFEIGADGQFTTWQLFNTLRDGQIPFHFAIKAGNTAKLLQTAGGPAWPRVKRIEMTGEYPVAVLRFEDDELPVGVELTAFTPFDPLDANFSSTPLAAFHFRLHNPGSQPQTVSLAALLANPVGYDATGIPIKDILHPDFGGNINETFRDETTAGLFMRAARSDPKFAKVPGCGALALATTAPNPTALLEFSETAEFWETFSRTGEFQPIAAPSASGPTPAGRTTFGALAAKIELPPGATAEVPFYLAWHYPNKFNDKTHEWIGCHYATRWPDARAVVREAASQGEASRARTDAFRRTMYDTTLPYWLIDCLTANAAIIRHIGVVFRIANGDVYGWEGSNGCCDPTCTHVWGYEQSLARLFPELERDMRRIDFKHQQRPDGGVNNRTAVPSPPHPTGENPFADGHASCILKAYREALNSPDESFFQDYWPHVKHAVEYLIDRDAATAGGQPQGVLQDDQWNTYDEALHGVTTFISGYYLAALRAGEEWARRQGDTAAAGRFHEIFLLGQKKLIDLCWNGEYFQQHLPDYKDRKGEFGPGCMSDQLIGQWWANQLDLGYLLPRDMVVSSLRSIFKYNFKSDLTGWKHAPRAFAGARDKGLIVCTWPKGGRPDNVLLYSDELWTGMEYQVAGHMLHEGLLAEGLSIVKAARDRYDGIPRPPIPRNPWNEIECGGHYARAMSSWSVLLALSGFHCDGPKGFVRFAPRLNPENFKSFFAAPSAWGSYTQTPQQAAVTVKSGRLKLTALELPFPNASKITATIANRSVPTTLQPRENAIQIHFGGSPTLINAGETLTVTLT